MVGPSARSWSSGTVMTWSVSSTSGSYGGGGPPARRSGPMTFVPPFLRRTGRRGRVPGCDRDRRDCDARSGAATTPGEPGQLPRPVVLGGQGRAAVDRTARGPGDLVVRRQRRRPAAPSGGGRGVAGAGPGAPGG